MSFVNKFIIVKLRFVLSSTLGINYYFVFVYKYKIRFMPGSRELTLGPCSIPANPTRGMMQGPHVPNNGVPALPYVQQQGSLGSYTPIRAVPMQGTACQQREKRHTAFYTRRIKPTTSPNSHLKYTISHCHFHIAYVTFQLHMFIYQEKLLTFDD